MAKFTFNRLATLVNATVAINGIITQIETALDSLLSRDGTAPNQMEASLDMNSNHIINLPAPSSPSSPVRYGDIDTTLVVTGVWVWQVKMALASLGHFYTVFNAIPALPTSTVNIAWSNGSKTNAGDTLYLFIESIIGTAAADSVYTLAETQSY